MIYEQTLQNIDGNKTDVGAAEMEKNSLKISSVAEVYRQSFTVLGLITFTGLNLINCKTSTILHSLCV